MSEPLQEQSDDSIVRAKGRCLIISGWIQFLAGLIVGIAIPSFVNSRMGLSAHQVGAQNGLVLLAAGVVWGRVALGPRLQAVAVWMLNIGLYGIFIALVLAAVWGTSKATPLAGAGYSGTPAQESTVEVMLTVSAVSTILSVVLILFGTIRGCGKNFGESQEP